MQEFQGDQVPIKAWIDGVHVESEAISLLKNVAKLPFIFRHVAVMPDVHVGIGCCIGSVIPTKDVVIPAAVGVDIGCFVGETKIPVLDGRDYEIKNLLNKRFCVYCCTENGHVVVRYATAIKTRENASLCKITLDNGEVIKCTLDQKFMLRDGSYKNAESLSVKQSLMPLYTGIREGYKTVMQPYSGRYQEVSWCVARSGLMGEIPKSRSKKPADRVIIHHMSFLDEIGVLDNRPEALKFMFAGEHSKMHRELGFSFTAELNADPEFQKKRMEGIKRRREDPIKQKKMVDVGTKNIVKFMTDNRDEFLEKVSFNGERGSEYLANYNKSDKGRKKSSEVAHRKYKCDICGELFEGGFRLYNHRQSVHPVMKTCDCCGREFKNDISLFVHKRYCSGSLVNHKVVSVEFIEEKEDVYCLRIEDLEGKDNPHNFGLSAGVFVHNCGMMALKTNLTIDQIPVEKRHDIRLEIERLIPTGRTCSGGLGDKGAWATATIPKAVKYKWGSELEKELQEILKIHPGILSRHGLNDLIHLGTLGGGNHFIEVCVDLDDKIWFMLHSGSRGVGNRIGQYFIELAKNKCSKAPNSEVQRIDREMTEYFKSDKFKLLPQDQKKFDGEQRRREADREKRACSIKLPHPELAYFTKDDHEFNDYLRAVVWAQKYAAISRMLMMDAVIKAVENVIGIKIDADPANAVLCHHNYVNKETHFGEEILVTRKGAISARLGERGIIPASMGAKSFIVEGLGNADSFMSASHGAGRKMSRSAAKSTFTVEDHVKATEGIECVKGNSVLDETPGAYKPIDAVMEAEKDLVKPIAQLRQIICVKGSE